MTCTYRTDPYYLHFPDLPSWIEIWSACELSQLDEETGVYFPIFRCHVVELGEIRRGGEWDDEGIEVVAPEILPGYHVNILLENDLVLPSALEQYLLPKPSQPQMIWSCEQDA